MSDKLQPIRRQLDQPADLRNMFTDPAFRPFTPRTSRRICCPNKLWGGIKDGKRIGILVVKRSSKRPNGDWPLNVAGIKYVWAAEREGRIDAGYVVLVDTTDIFIAAVPIAAVVVQLHDQPTWDGQWGPFWWVTADLTPARHYEDAF